MNLFLFLILACSSPDPAGATGGGAAPAGAVAIEATLDEAGNQSAEALLAELDGTHFKSKARRSAANAQLFLVLAARDTGAHEIAAASLEGMYETWSDKDVKDKPAANEDYAKVVLAYLDHSDPLLQARAIQAAKHLLRQGHAETVAKIVGLAGKSPAHTFDALDALSQVKDWGKDEAIAAVYVNALDGENYVASQALFRLETKAFSFVKKDEAAPKIKGLLGHADPGVRGRAALAYAGFEKDKAAASEAIAPLLKDDNAFTRSAAARAIGNARATGLAGDLVGMLDDTAKNTYDIEGWKQLDGSDGRVHHDGSAWSRVDDAVLNGLRTMGGTNGSARLELTKVRHDHVDEDLAKCKEEAKAWYEANKDKLAK
ncbi:MAG: HEAT repeat domain-containing protein [Deltaproteobacteria bacterium]|nr:MAG: HEAT repeat domain-containing protein [Deltaproteobacteria bacterium]